MPSGKEAAADAAESVAVAVLEHQAADGAELDDTKIGARSDLSRLDPRGPYAAAVVDRSGRPYRFAVYAYRVLAVDTAGKVGGPSPAQFTIPSSPQHLFSREDGQTCRLKWAANPEKGIAGYRVYRLDGRWNEDPVSRLTPDVIAATRFTDETAGKHTRRYYVVAVDTIGQEGFPSSPVVARLVQPRMAGVLCAIRRQLAPVTP